MWPFKKESLVINRKPIDTNRTPGFNPKFQPAFEQVKMLFGLLYDRIIQYNEYENMLQDSLISSAIELYTEDATQASPETKKPFWISTTNEFLQREFDEFCTRLDLQRLYPDICYNLCLYGDQFIRLYWGNTNEGLLHLDYRIHPADVEKAALGSYTLGFRYDNRMWTGKDFYHVKLCFNKAQRREFYNWMVVRLEGFDFRIRTDYGTSVLENARKIYKIMNLLENCLIIARFSRSPLQQIIGIQFGEDSTNTEALDFLNKMKEALTEEQTIDLLTKDFESSKQSFRLMQRLFIPLFGEKGSLQVENLNGTVDIKDIADLEYFRSKLFGALRCPKAYLGLEESLPGSLGQSALARLEIRYAKNTKRVQSTMLQTVNDLFAMHLVHIGRSDLLNQYIIEGAVISTMEEEERKDSMEKSMTMMQTMIDTLSGLELVPEEKEEKKSLLKTLNKLFVKIPGFSELFDVKKEAAVPINDNYRILNAETFWEQLSPLIRAGAVDIVKSGYSYSNKYDQKVLQHLKCYSVKEAVELCHNKLLEVRNGSVQGSL